MVYRMIFNQTAYFGRGAIKEIPAVAKQHGFTKAFIVTDPVLLETGTAEKVTKVLDEAGLPYEVFSNVKPNPPVECIKDGVAKFAESGADFLIGLGGGSPARHLQGHRHHHRQPGVRRRAFSGRRRGYQEPVRPDLRRADHRRHRLGDDHQLRGHRHGQQAQVRGCRPARHPDRRFRGPGSTDSMPRGLKVATGLDALTHAIEGYITPGAWSLSDCLSMQTIRMIAKNLAKSADGDIPAGEQMAYASYITGMAYSNVGLGLVHGMAHPLGGRLGVAHGGPTVFCWPRSWNTTRTSPVRSTATSPMRSVLRTPTPATWRRCAKRPCRPSTS